MGYADRTADTFSDIHEWRDTDLHLLGGSPSDQYHVIQQLTQPTLDETSPANIVGLDGNGVQKVAYYGEYWTSDSYEPADGLSIRETVDRSLREMKQFWQERGVWPATTPVERDGLAVIQPDEPVYVEHGGSLRTKEAVESAVIGDYKAGTYAFDSEAGKRFVECREGWQETG